MSANMETNVNANVETGPLFAHAALAAVVPRRLFYYRCTWCLSVVTSKSSLDLTKTFCNCSPPSARGPGGKYEFVGRVKAKRLEIDGMAPPCDGRCTNAKGPNCDCQCRCANHGSGLLVPVTKDGGPAPLVTSASPERGKEYSEARQRLLDAYERRFPGVIRDMIGSRGTSRNNAANGLWWNLMRAAKLRTHQGRLDYLAGAVAKVTKPAR